MTVFKKWKNYQNKKNNMGKSKEELFQAPADIMKIETMASGGVRIVVDTAELTDNEELAKLFQLKKGQRGWFLFKSSEIAQDDLNLEELPTIVAEEGEKKTPSERLRGVLFVYWKNVKGGKGDFNGFYRNVIEQLINMYKEKLPPQAD